MYPTQSWQDIMDELTRCYDDPQQRLGAAVQMVVSARANGEFWKQLSQEYREERDHYEELFAKGGVK